jgi:hypothetical protein
MTEKRQISQGYIIRKKLVSYLGLGVNWDESPVPFPCHDLYLSLFVFN